MWQRISNLFKGFAGLFVSNLERRNPEALLEVEKENLRKQIGQYNTGLASHAGMCERLMAQVRKLEGEERETTYKDLTKARDVAITAAKAKIESLKSGIEDMKMKRAMAEMNEMASGMITSIGGSGDTLNRLHDMVEEERNKAAGRARVAKDSLSMQDVNIKEAEQEALAAQALADFASREGIALPQAGMAPTPVAVSEAPVGKSMGPAQSN